MSSVRIESRMLFLEQELRTNLIRCSTIKTITDGTNLLGEGQHIRALSLVLRGTLKVCIRNEEKDLLLYHIHPHESYIMSFAGVANGEKSRIYADAMDETEIMLIPANLVETLLAKFRAFGKLFLKQYQNRYHDLLENIRQFVFHKLDERLLQYLHGEAERRNTETLDLRRFRSRNSPGSHYTHT